MLLILSSDRLHMGTYTTIYSLNPSPFCITEFGRMEVIPMTMTANLEITIERGYDATGINGKLFQIKTNFISLSSTWLKRTVNDCHLVQRGESPKFGWNRFKVDPPKIMLTRQIRTPVLRIPPAVTSQAKMKNWLHECQKWVSHMIGQYAHI